MQADTWNNTHLIFYYIYLLYSFMLLLQPLLLLLYGKVGGYHDPAAAWQCSYVPLRLPSLELFDPVGRPCSPLLHDSVTAPPPDHRTHRETDIRYLCYRNQTETCSMCCVCQSSVFQYTCQWPRLTALKSGATPLLLAFSTAAPWSNNKLHTDSLPLPAAAVRADTQRVETSSSGTYQSVSTTNEIIYITDILY